MATQSNVNDSEEYLKEYLQSNDYKQSNNQGESKQEEKVQDLGTHKDLEFVGIDISELPCHYFYPAGTTVFVRPAKVTEIQAFSVVDDTNYYDMFEKVNNLIESCVFLKYPDQRKVPYTHLVDGDRWYLLFVIRELTFQKGNDLYTEVKKTKIPIKRGYFEFHEIDEKLEKYYDRVSGKFIVETKGHGTLELAPPTLGLQKSFSDYMIKTVQSKKELDQSFLKVVPYLMPGRTSITEEGIQKKLEEYQNLSISKFQLLDQLVDRMSFGIKGVKSVDGSGMEVRSEDIFPGGIKRLFIQSDSLDDFLA